MDETMNYIITAEDFLTQRKRTEIYHKTGTNFFIVTKKTIYHKPETFRDRSSMTAMFINV